MEGHEDNIYKYLRYSYIIHVIESERDREILHNAIVQLSLMPIKKDQEFFKLIKDKHDLFIELSYPWVQKKKKEADLGLMEEYKKIFGEI